VRESLAEQQQSDGKPVISELSTEAETAKRIDESENEWVDTESKAQRRSAVT